MKKMVFFIPSLNGGGAEKATLSIANQLSKYENEYSCTIILQNDENRKYIPHPNITVISLGKTKARHMFWKLRKTLKIIKPDIFYSALPHMNIIAYSVIKSLVFSKRPKLIVSLHNNPIIEQFSLNKLEKFIFLNVHNNSSHVICVSNGVKDKLIEFGIRKEILSVIYNPIDIEDIISQGESPDEHCEFKKKHTYNIISMGRLTKQKGFEYLLNAFSIVRDNLNAGLVIYGSGEESEHLHELANELRIKDDVLFAGFSSNPFSSLKNSDIFVLSSLWEGFGMVIVESMALGVPVISFDCEFGPNEIISNGVNGILVPIKETKILAHEIIKLLQNKLKREEMSNNSLLTASKFSAPSIVLEYKQLFDKILHE